MWWVSPEFEAEAAAMIWVTAAQEKNRMPTSGADHEETSATKVCTPQKLKQPRAGKPCSLRTLRMASKKGASTSQNSAASSSLFADLEAASPAEAELLPNVCYSFMLWLMASKGRADLTALTYGRSIKNLFNEHGRSFKTMCSETYANRIQESGGQVRHTLLQVFGEFWTWHHEGPNPSWDQAPADFCKDMQRVWRECMAEKTFKKQLATAKKRAADRPIVEAETPAKKPRISENYMKKIQEAKQLSAQKHAAWLAAAFAAGNRATPSQEEEGAEGESSTAAGAASSDVQTSTGAAASEVQAST